MAQHKSDLTPKEFHEWIEEWHKDELVRIRKTAAAQELDATGFVTAYLGGKLSRHQASEKWMEYLERWGDPQFEGSPDLNKMNDSQVIKLAEKIRRERKREMGIG